MTFAIGLACVPFSSVVYEKWTDIYVDLPEIESDAPIIVFPMDIEDVDCCAGSICNCKFLSDA